MIFVRLHGTLKSKQGVLPLPPHSSPTVHCPLSNVPIKERPQVSRQRRFASLLTPHSSLIKNIFFHPPGHTNIKFLFLLDGSYYQWGTGKF